LRDRVKRVPAAPAKDDHLVSVWDAVYRIWSRAAKEGNDELRAFADGMFSALLLVHKDDPRIIRIVQESKWPEAPEWGPGAVWDTFVEMYAGEVIGSTIPVPEEFLPELGKTNVGEPFKW